MKKLILTAAIAVTLVTGAFADGSTKTSAAANVSSQIQNQFDAQFGIVDDVTWTTTAVGLKAEFMLDDVKKAAFYNNNDQFIGTTENVSYKVLPKAAKKEIAAKYAGYQVGEVIKFEAPQTPNALERLTIADSDSVAYFVDLKNDKEEFLIRVTPFSKIYFYKQIK